MSVEGPTRRAIRVLSIVEATTITGPARNLLEFCRVIERLHAQPSVVLSIATFARGRQHLGGTATNNDFLEAVRAAKIEAHCILERFAFDPYVVDEIQKVVRSFGPDIIQTHQVKSHFLVRFSGLWKTSSWIAFHHGYTSDAKRTALYNQLDRWSLRYPSRIVTVCEAFKNQLASRGAPISRIRVLHNSISSDWLEDNTGNDKSARTIALPPNKRLVLAVGRLSREKAFEDLVLGIHHLLQLRPKLCVQTIIVGEGPERTHLQSMIDKLELRNHVTLAGYVRDIRSYYRAADIVAISSISEGSPNVLLEAMAAGVPVVATLVGGIPEIVSDKQTALLIPPKKPSAMALALDTLLTDSRLAQAMSAEARTVIKKRFSPKARALRLLSLYDEVVQRNCPR